LTTLATRLGVADRVRFFGFRNDRLDFLRGFDVLVLPSALEGIPRCLMEAMAAGVPVVGSRIPGIADLIDDGQTGLMFDLGYAEQLEERLTRLLVDPALCEGLAFDAKRRVTESFSASAMALNYQRLYRRLIVPLAGVSKITAAA
jgi:glycosyltransferase involved in cell wall biosynthesis